MSTAAAAAAAGESAAGVVAAAAERLRQGADVWRNSVACRSKATGASSRCGDRRRPRSPVAQLDGGQSGLNLRPLRFQPWRQLQAPAQLGDRLVGGKAGSVGGDLEQHAARLAE